jgi:hypothetical protein
MTLVGQPPPAARARLNRRAAGENLLITMGGDTVYADGVLDELTVDLLLAAADYLFSRGSLIVTLDLSRARSIDSDAIRELFTAQTDVGTGLCLRLTVPAHLRPRLAICRLDEPATAVLPHHTGDR